MICWRTGVRRWREKSVAMAAVLVLAACQPGSPPELGPSGSPWRVIETSGEVRIEQQGLLYGMSLRSGDEFASDSRVFVEKSGHLIMSRSDVQFTANGRALITLSASGAPTVFSHDRGRIRVRFTAAANAPKRLATPHLVASGTNAVLDLDVDDQGTDIKVIDGSVTLSTSNGRHYAKLVSGAAARLGDKTDGQMEIQPAAEKPFRPSPTIEATATSDASPAPKPAARPTTKMRQASKPDHRSKAPVTFAVLPAARLKPEVRPPANNAKSEMAKPIEPALLSAGSAEPAPVRATPIGRRTPLEKQFDQLTEGLLDGLPSVTPQNVPYR